MFPKVPLDELNNRMANFRAVMDAKNPDWQFAAFFGKINIYYFTGTMQEGLLFIPRSSDAIFWVRRSYERAMDESHFKAIRVMDSFRDAASAFKAANDSVYLETEIVPLALFQRFQKYFPFSGFKSLDNEIAAIRAVKSKYELEIMEESGAIHKTVLEVRVPKLLKEGISEAELATALFSAMVEEGHQGLVRFGMFNSEMVLGHIAFGESAIYPTSFNGPGGNYGLSPAVPMLGSRHRKLKSGDLVFIDIGCGVNGYHTDKTMTYMFGKPLLAEVIEIHKQCLAIQNQIAKMLVPGAIPSEIYKNVIESLNPEFLKNFMGYGNRQVRFLGHGIGLTIDEYPVIANGFNEPIKENMVFALEPKKGIKDIGMVGVENTFVVEPNGGRCITGDNPGLIPVF